MRKVSRAEEQFSEINFRTAQEKEAINLNIVHDVATMAPHALNALKDVGHSVANEFDRFRHDVAGVGHSVANEFDRARHDVAGVGHSVANEFDRGRHDVAVPFAGVGHNDLDLAKNIGDAFVPDPTNSPDNINHFLYNYLSSPSVGRFPVGTPHHEIYNIVQHWRANGGQMGGNALHNYPGLDKASGEILSQDLKNKFDAMNTQGEMQFMKDVGSAALTVLAPAAIGLGIKQHRDKKFSSFDDRYAFEKTAILAPVDLGGAVQHGVNLVTELVGGGAALGLGKVVKNVVNKVKDNRATDKSDLKVRQDMWHMYGPHTQQMLIEHNDETANPFHPDHDLNRPYGRSVGNSYYPAFMPRGRSASSSFDEHYAFEKTAKEESKGEKGFKPPAGVQSAARHALKLIEEGKAGDGFTSVGRGRAHQLANGETLSLSTVKRMHSYFSRHRVDKKGKDWDNDSPGKVAWLAWGGDAGASWAAGICAKHDGKKEASAWPSSEHYEEHLEDLEELLHDTQKGVEWHEGQGEPAEKAKHQQLAEDLVKSIADARKLEK